jgi:hypothetical protein
MAWDCVIILQCLSGIKTIRFERATALPDPIPFENPSGQIAVKTYLAIKK